MYAYFLGNDNERNVGCSLSQRRKERGRIAVESVHVVETASLGSNAGGVGGVGSDVAGSEAGTGGGGGGGGGGIPPGLPFQVGYREAGQEYTLYLLAAREQDRAEWIRAIRAGKFFLLFSFTRLILCQAFFYDFSLFFLPFLCLRFSPFYI